MKRRSAFLDRIFLRNLQNAICFTSPPHTSEDGMGSLVRLPLVSNIANASKTRERKKAGFLRKIIACYSPLLGHTSVFKMSNEANSGANNGKLTRLDLLRLESFMRTFQYAALNFDFFTTSCCLGKNLHFRKMEITQCLPFVLGSVHMYVCMVREPRTVTGGGHLSL